MIESGRRALAAHALVWVALISTAVAGCHGPGIGAAPPAGARTHGDPQAIPRWTPVPGTTWQWQLSGVVDTTVDAQVFDIDAVQNDAEVVARLHARGARVICYVNAGAAEDFRPDRAAFPASIVGESNGWPGEHWLDIRQLDLLRPIMAARFELCRQKKFDAVEADLVDGYAHETGFQLTAQDQLAYNRLLAALAHERGLSIGLKNDLGQVPDLVTDFDFAINEQCVQYAECDRLLPFIRMGKAVFHAEYDTPNSQFCPTTAVLGFASIGKRRSLDAKRWPC